MEEKNWYLYIVDHHEGPFSTEEIKSKVLNGQADKSSFVWRDGFSDWTLMSDVQDFGPATNLGPPGTDFVGKPGFIAPKKTMTQAKALGLGKAGRPTVKRYRWYKSTKFSFLLFIAGVVSIYQSATKGQLDSILSMTGTLQQFKSLNLSPIPFEKIPLDQIPASKGYELAKNQMQPFLNTSYGNSITSAFKTVQSYFEKVLSIIPEPIRSKLKLGGVEVPETLKQQLSPNQIEFFKEMMEFPPSESARVFSAPLKNSSTRQFILMSNLPDQSRFTIILKSKPRAVLSESPVEDVSEVQLQSHFAYSKDFSNLPRGDYTLNVFESDEQIKPIQVLLSALPRKNAPSNIPAGKVAFVSDSIFLGGTRDTAFQQELDGFFQQIAQEKLKVLSEFKQAVLTLESAANESASRFFSLMKKKKDKKIKKQWVDYHARYVLLSSQLKQMVANERFTKIDGSLVAAYSEAFDSSLELHALEDQNMNGKNNMAEIQQVAVKTSSQIKVLKSKLP